MAIKGTTKIQLFDAATGELTDEIVQENMVTNAVHNILNPANQMFLGSGNYSRFPVFARNCAPIGKVLFGGILIFNRPLEEDVNHIIPSIEERNGIVGYAGQFASVTGNNLKGSYNSAESIELENGYTHVWDFTTEQANGEIAAVALTSAMGGDAGWDATENNASRGNFLIPITNAVFTGEDKTITTIPYVSNDLSTMFYGVGVSSPYTKYTALVTNGKYALLAGIDNSSSVVGIKYISKIISNDITLNQVINNSAFNTGNIGIHSEGLWTSDVLTSSYTASLTRAQVMGNVIRYVFTNAQYLYNNTVTITLVDFVLNDDGSVTIKSPVTFSIKASDVQTVVAAEADDFVSGTQRCYLEPGYAYYGDTYAYIQTIVYNSKGTGTYFVRINISNTSDIQIFKKPAGTKGLFAIGTFAGEVIVSYKGTKSIYRTTDFINYKRVDGIINLYGYDYTVWDLDFIPMKKPYVGLCTVQIGSTSYTRSVVPCLIAPYLGTINNLDRTVTKTTAKTMKITYTIQNV